MTQPPGGFREKPIPEPKLGRKTPCAECPWRVTARRGYLGQDEPVHFYWASITQENLMPCHEQIDYSDPDWINNQLGNVDICAGNLIHFKNSNKVPRYAPLAEAVKAVKKSAAVFVWSFEFLWWHMPLATNGEVRAAVQEATAPFRPTGSYTVRDLD